MPIAPSCVSHVRHVHYWRRCRRARPQSGFRRWLGAAPRGQRPLRVCIYHITACAPVHRRGMARGKASLCCAPLYRLVMAMRGRHGSCGGLGPRVGERSARCQWHHNRGGFRLIPRWHGHRSRVRMLRWASRRVRLRPGLRRYAVLNVLVSCGHLVA